MSYNWIPRGLLWFAASSLLSAGIALGQMQGPPTQGPPNSASPGIGQRPGMDESRPSTETESFSQQQMDQKFVHDALQGGMAEVALGKLAAEKGSNDDVKKFGQRMVDDHTRLGEQMKPVAQQIGVKIPTTLAKQDNELLTKLQGLSGSDFDAAYLQAMVKDHKKDYAEFQRESESAVIPAVKDAAQKGAPVIKSHLDEVQQLAKSNAASSGVTRK
ncbi:MAG TPA: DUF4142 domain-containing protein [Acidisarcina sp.]|nr:DUF4142 domain-containing protein [Acidisarcina sp.]